MEQKRESRNKEYRVSQFTTRESRTHNWERQSLQQMVLVKLHSHMQKAKSGHQSTPYLKFNSKRINGLNMRPEIIKFLKENRFHNIAFGNDFFGDLTKSKGNKSKNKQISLHQTKKLLHSKGNYQQNENRTGKNSCKSYI